jgi:hypothetical protein
VSSSQDEETKTRPNGIVQEEEMHIEEPQEFREGARKKKNHK